MTERGYSVPARVLENLNALWDEIDQDGRECESCTYRRAYTDDPGASPAECGRIWNRRAVTYCNAGSWSDCPPLLDGLTAMLDRINNRQPERRAHAG